MIDIDPRGLNSIQYEMTPFRRETKLKMGELPPLKVYPFVDRFHSETFGKVMGQ